MSGNKKGEWEKRKIIETKNDGKKFWNLIKDLLGKNKNKDEDVYVYTEGGIKTTLMKLVKNTSVNGRKRYTRKQKE